MTAHLLLASLLIMQPATLPTTAPAEREGWRLVWSDEFDQAGAPDASKWTYEEGFVRNREEQYYTVDRRENARVENGHLVIEARREAWPNARFNPDADPDDWSRARETAPYTSAALITRGKADFQYGRIEMRAKMPEGCGTWPAFWTLGVNISDVGWPRCGEIDVMEWVGHTPELTHGTVHFADPQTKQHASRGGRRPVEDVSRTFHVYAIEWDEEKIDFYFDEANYFTFDLSLADPIDEDGQRRPADNPFRRPHYLLLNLAIGGAWGREVDPEIFPQQYVIDYVRVYEREDQE